MTSGAAVDTGFYRLCRCEQRRRRRAATTKTSSSSPSEQRASRPGWESNPAAGVPLRAGGSDEVASRGGNGGDVRQQRRRQWRRRRRRRRRRARARVKHELKSVAREIERGQMFASRAAEQREQHRKRWQCERLERTPTHPNQTRPGERRRRPCTLVAPRGALFAHHGAPQVAGARAHAARKDARL